jgi:hypothetical protein
VAWESDYIVFVEVKSQRHGRIRQSRPRCRSGKAAAPGACRARVRPPRGGGLGARPI